ncbi:MAG TPA: SRPBCC family protein [Pirellulales bacterium]|nr:SRPBCC family protein [Pirellulales bacterium]
MAAKSNSRDINIIRVYDAPVALVWDAWTDPAQVAQWWGPRGFTLTTHSKDLRVGGHWNYTMHGPDGTDYENTTLYHEVEEHAKLVYDHGGHKDRPPLFRVTALFTDLGGKTRLEMTMTLPTPEAADETRKFIRKAGGDSTWDRLAEYVEKRQTGKEKFVINRAFDVPLDVMFDMWSKPEHLSKWLPPTGFDMEFVRADLRPGGSSFYYMSGAGDMKMYGHIDYREITKPNRLVYTQQFCDEHEKVSRHPMSPTWPETMLTIVELTAEGPERTRVTVTWEPVGAVSREELETFINARAGMTQGWTGSFDKLEEYAANK